jgi:hypothetical protein
MNTIKMNRLTPFFLLILGAGVLLTAGCKKDEKGTEQETITTIVLHFTGAGLDQEFEWSDTDGDGGNAPNIQEIVLPALSTNINCHVYVYDKSKNPVADITEEIEEESNEHLLVYRPDAALGVTWNYNDTDGNGKPLGVQTRWNTTAPATGKLRVTLYHEPGTKDDLNNPGGEVDFDVEFPVKIQG